MVYGVDLHQTRELSRRRVSDTPRSFNTQLGILYRLVTIKGNHCATRRKSRPLRYMHIIYCNFSISNMFKTKV